LKESQEESPLVVTHNLLWGLLALKALRALLCISSVVCLPLLISFSLLREGAVYADWAEQGFRPEVRVA